MAVGQNGQGKTNLLEALYFLATLKPLRAAPALGAGPLRRRARAGHRALPAPGRGAGDLAWRSPAAIRQAFVDGKKAASLEDYFGGVSVVAFTPDDLDVVKGGPEGRPQLPRPRGVQPLPGLPAREPRLRAGAEEPEPAAARSGAAATTWTPTTRRWRGSARGCGSRRRALLAELAPRAQRRLRGDRPHAGPGALRLHPVAPGAGLRHRGRGELQAQALREALETAAAAGPASAGFTSVGPHADDLELSLGEPRARAFASQGQQRALVLAWKIAEIENLHAALGFLPLLLLDDVSSELDPRAERLS